VIGHTYDGATSALTRVIGHKHYPSHGILDKFIVIDYNKYKIIT
jgi:hypothetical protein